MVAENRIGNRRGCWVGTERESQILDEVLDRLDSGAAAVIEVIGEPGIGKTRLLTELAFRAMERGIQVLAGQASYARSHIPGDVLVNTLADPVTRLTPAAARPAAPDAASLCDADLPDLTAAEGNPRAPEVQAVRVRLYRQLRSLLEEMTATGGLVLLLDDLHWGDEMSVDLVDHLVRRPPHGPVLLAFAYRHRQASLLLRSMTAGSRLHPAPIRLHLKPLSERDAQHLIGAHGSPSWRKAIYRESGGNPFYLEVLIRSAHRPRPAADASTASPGELPPEVTADLLAGLEALSPLAQEVARAAAICGDPFCASYVASAGGLDEARASDGLREMADHDLIRSATGGFFAFRHHLIRAAIYDSTNLVWRVAAHARTASALERLGAPVTTRAHHVERCAAMGDLRAIALLEEAARTAGDHTPATAVGWLEVALRLLPDDADSKPVCLRIMVALAQAHGAAGHLRKCHAMAQDVLRLLPRSDSTARAAAATLCAVTGRLLGHRPEARALLQAEVAELPDPSTPAAAALAFELAVSALTSVEAADGRRQAEQALSAAVHHKQRPLQAAAYGVLAVAEAAIGEASRAAAHADSAVPLIDALLETELAEHLEAAAWVGRGELLLERLPDGLRHIDRAMLLAYDQGQRLLLPELLTTKILLLRELGRLPEAAECADDVVNLAMGSGSGEWYTAAMLLRCWVATWMGDLRVALNAAAAVPAGQAPGGMAFAATRILAEAHLAEGDIPACLDLVEAEGGPHLPTVPAWARTGWYEMLTRAELAAGRIEAAAQWAGYAQASARRWELPGHTGTALLAQAHVRAAQAEPSSHQLAIAAHNSLDAAGLVLDAARARLLAATVVAASGTTGQATAELAAVQAVFASRGAARLAQQAMATRRRLVARTRPRRLQQAQTGLGVLTSRERQVATLVSQGLSNRVVSRRLHISEKTVEKHLSSSFTKLEVSSRSQVTAIVLRAQASAPRQASRPPG